MSSREIPFIYEIPLGGSYQEYVGGTYPATEIFSDYYRANDFLDPNRTRLGESRISRQRISSWLPWMKMHDLPGIIRFNANGYSTFDKSRIPPRLTQVLIIRYSEYLTPPPLGDGRENATTWTVTKKWIDGRRSNKENK